MGSYNNSFKLYITLLIGIGFVAQVSAIDYSIGSNQVRDNWTQQEIESNPVEINVELNETEGFQSVDVDDSGVPFSMISFYNSSSSTVELDTDVPLNTEAGDYEVPFTLSSNQSSISNSFNVTVLPRYEGNYTFRQENNNLNVGDSGTLGFFDIENEGNTDFDFSYSFNSSYIPLQNETVNVEQQEDYKERVIFDIPDNIEAGQYNVTAQIDAPFLENQTEETINFNLIDDNPPTIDYINVSDTEALKTIPIDVGVTDNTGVESIEAEVTRNYQVEVERNNQTVIEDRTDEMAQFEFTEIEEGLWSYDYSSTNGVGEYVIDITVTDESGNVVNESTTFQVSELNAIESPYDVENKVAQTGALTQARAFNLTYSTDMSLKLTKFEYGRSVQRSSVELVTPSGDERSFSSVGDVVDFSEEGEYRINFKGNREGEYRMNFEFQTPEAHAETDTLNIYGDLVDISVPQDIQQSWTGAEYIKCETRNLNSENIQEARYFCEIPFYINQTASIDETPIPILPSVQEQNRVEYENQISNLEEDLGWSQAKHWIKNFGFVVMLGIFGFYVIIYPKLLFFLR